MPLRHGAIPVLTFAAVTAWWLFPVLSNLSTVVPGPGAGDNVTFVWNVWWMRYVFHHSGQTFFFTPFLFHPVGVDLTLHTHTALPALLGAAWSSPIAGQNAVIALHVYLNFLCSYWLAHRLTGQVVSSLLAAVIFGASAFVGAHLNGHFNLIAAWTLPLVSLVTSNTLQQPSWIGGVFVGLVLAATAYTDYYLFVYAVVVVMLLCVSQTFSVDLRGEFTSQKTPRNVRRRALIAVLSLLIVDAFVTAAILVFPGDRVDIGPLHVSVRSVRNPITIAWCLLLLAGAIAAPARFRLTRKSDGLKRSRNALTAAIVATVVLLMPILIHAVVVWRAGGYVSQAYLWRSAPAGVDAATLFLGNPFHAAWGESVRSFYGRLHSDVIESSAWIPVGAIALAIAAIVFRRSNVTPWVLAGTVFAIWALGPWLTLFGRQTPLILPAILLRFIPIAGNARIPGRAMVVVSLMIAVLAAMGFERLLERGRIARMAAWCLAVLLMIECVPGRPPLYVPDMPSKYFTLTDGGKAGAVCELPLGLRDGFGQIGSLDEAVLLHQTIHERPIVGGFVARLPPALVRAYTNMPIIGSLLQLSSGGKVLETDLSRSPREAAAMLASAGIAVLILDTRRASPDLVAYVQSKIALRQIAEEDGRIFYEVE